MNESRTRRPATGPRIVSLLPSATEIVCAVGAGDNLVGRSHECDHPPGVERLPACSRPRIAIDSTSRRIDTDIRSLVREGLSVYEVREDVLRALAPDVVVTQAQCEVCAVSEREVAAALASWTGSTPALVSLTPSRLADVFEDVLRVARALGSTSRAETVVADLRQRVERLARRANEQRDRPRVACVEWLDPLMAAGNWVPELVELAGGENIFGIAGEHSPWLDWAALRDADPDVVVVMPCGFTLERTLAESTCLAALPGWADMAAVRNGRVYATDGHQLFNRPGPRLVESLEVLTEVLHPGAIEHGHAGRLWRPVARPT